MTKVSINIGKIFSTRLRTRNEAKKLFDIIQKEINIDSKVNLELNLESVKLLSPGFADEFFNRYFSRDYLENHIKIINGNKVKYEIIKNETGIEYFKFS